jgi:hypothetical protein
MPVLSLLDSYCNFHNNNFGRKSHKSNTTIPVCLFSKAGKRFLLFVGRKKIKGEPFQNYKDNTYLEQTDKEIAKQLNGEQLIGTYTYFQITHSNQLINHDNFKTFNAVNLS